MHVPPRVLGGLVARWSALLGGLFLFAVAIVCMLEAELGLSPWDVLHQGIAKHTPLSFGLANVVVAIGVLFLAWRLGSRPGIGTVANAVLIGLFVALLVRLSVVQDLAGWPLLVRVALLVAGLALFGFGTALYIGAAVGAGPRDSLMLVGALRSGLRIGGARVLLEGTALVTGFLLGGTVGIGTLVFALLIGPAVEASFWLVNRIGLAA